ncbi:MAG: sigma 54-interacting transcriptional regulator [Myxococcales bacterium]|nr:sigma 54-interacting transcriptional regulator [Myxococcales bacterium]
MTLLTDPDSPYAKTITDVVVFRQGGVDGSKYTEIYEELVAALAEHGTSPRLYPEIFEHDDPTDHNAIYEYLRKRVPVLRRKFRDRELVIHLSPGTAAMHTVWVLMVETGFVEEPFVAVQSVRQNERQGGKAVIPFALGLDTFFKRWKKSTVPASKTSRPLWDPSLFRTQRLRALYEEARRVAQIRVPVLILGERGTGKTTIASWIRMRSPFRKPALDSSWPAVPCGQYSPETMRSELFGYVRGAFTGAHQEKQGLLERANGDTLLLDEIGDISRDLQRLLIKVVEEGEYYPLGSDRARRTELRLLTATNQTLSQLQRNLDADFFDRISPFVLSVPPLREIQDELEWLWPKVLADAARRARVPTRYADLNAIYNRMVIEALRKSPLRRNVRDLFRVAYRLLAARADSDAPLQPRAAVEYALEAIDADDAKNDVPRSALIRAFLENAAIPAALVDDGPINPKHVIDDLKHWFAREVPKLAQRSNKPIAEITTIGERSLRGWRRKNSAGASE